MITPSILSFLRFATSLLLLILLSLRSLDAQSSTVTRELAPGIKYSHEIREGPFSIHVLELDLRYPGCEVASYRSRGLVRTSAQVRSAEIAGSVVVGAINADFFSFKTGWPVGNQVQDGKYVVGLKSGRSHLLMTASGKPLMERISFSGSVRTAGGNRYQLGRVNGPTPQDAIGVFTSPYGESADSARTNIALTLLSDSWIAGDTLDFVVAARRNEGTMSIPSNGAVLSFSGENTKEWDGSFDVGDTVFVYLGFFPHSSGITQVVGGAGRILRNGKFDVGENLDEEKVPESFMTDRHPRTFVAIDRDTTKLFLCAVDGRQESSAGMTFEEMASFLLSIGAWNAVNLDGGGSTTMVIDDEVVNSPSDVTGERAVANILMVVQKAQ